MALINTSTPNLSQGVSQQPDNLRFPGQHEVQENALSSVVDGLRKRPFTEFVGELGTDTAIDPDSFVYLINRDADNRHLLVIEPDTAPVIYDTADGSSINLYDAPTGTTTSYPTYTNTLNPRRDLQALTVADTTFILNKATTVGAVSNNSDAQSKKAIVFVKQGDYAKDYHVDIVINGDATHCTYTSGGGTTATGNNAKVNGVDTTANEAGDAPGSAKDASSELIAQGIWAAIIDKNISDIVVTLAHLEGDILTPSVVAPDYSDVTNGNAILIEYAGNDSFLVQTHDGISGEGVGVIEDEINSINDLPISTFEDNHVKISGDIEVDQDDYYVKFENTSGEAFDGSIKEIKLLSKGSTYSDATAGPHNLIFTGGGGSGAVGTFTLANYSGNWRVETITLTDGGTGYTSTPTLDFSDAGTSAEDATAQVTLFNYNHGKWVETIAPDTPQDLVASTLPLKLAPQSHLYIASTTLTSGGSGYDNGTFDLIFTGGGTPTTEAVGTFVVSGGVITTVTISNTGEGYSSAPTLGFSNAGSGSGEDITANMSDGESYYIATNTWTSRLVGDTTTNPDPSFIGKTIENLFFWKNRLGFLSRQNVIFSESDEYYNFFRTTVLQLLDTAPIDVAISHTKVSNLKHVIPLQERLIIFSEETQFVVKGNELLTPKTINVTPSTEYISITSIPPLAQGNFLYFAFPRNSYNGISEYGIDVNTETQRADEITGHVPKYIPATIRQLAGSSTEDIMVATTTATNGETNLYVYKYFWRGQERVQSAWSKFTFQDDIVAVFFVESDMYLVTEDGTSTYLEKMQLESGLVDSGEDYVISLDKRRTVSTLSPSYSSSTDLTTIDIGYPVTNAQLWTQAGTKATKDASSSGNTLVVKGDYTESVSLDFSNSAGGSGASATAVFTNGVITSFTSLVGGSSYEDGTFDLIITGGSPSTTPDIQFTVSSGAVTGFTITDGGNYTSYVGLPITSTVTLTRPILKQSADGGGRSVSNFAKQQVRNGSIEYANTGHFKVSVAEKFRDTHEHIFNAQILGSDTQLGTLVLQDGTFSFPVYANVNDITITLSSDSALPFQWLSTEFESTVSTRSRRIGS